MAELKLNFNKASPQCLLCRGTKLLCGRSYCPILARYSAMANSASNIEDLEFTGSSPPSIFVGRYGYPNVFTGPLLLSSKENPAFYDSPDLWNNINIFDLISLRSSLIRGKFRANVHGSGGRMLDYVQELALSPSPAEIEAVFEKKPVGDLILDEDVQPMGPSVPLSDLKVYGARGDSSAEKVVYDTDLKAADGILKLYDHGISVYRVQRILSAGLLGSKKDRKLVPTRWAITTVDDTTSQALLEKIKDFPELSEYQLYKSDSMDNTYIILLMPGKWEYELVEAWYPGSTWNSFGSSVEIYSSYEGYNGRKSYAEIGGCYYAGRLAVAEALIKLRKQGKAIILREAREGYLLPVGVWHVRENVRQALRGNLQKFGTLNEALSAISAMSRVTLTEWVAHSKLLFELLHRTLLSDFAKRRRGFSSETP